MCAANSRREKELKIELGPGLTVIKLPNCNVAQQIGTTQSGSLRGFVLVYHT